MRLPADILIVDDGSRSEEWRVIESFVAHTPDCRAVRLRQNIGQHRATLVGMLLAQPGSVITLDDDSPHELVQAIHSNESILTDPSKTTSLHFLQTRHGGDVWWSALLGGMAKALIRVLTSFLSYPRASSTRVVSGALRDVAVQRCTDSGGDLVIPARRISLDAFLLSCSPKVTFSATPLRIPRAESRYTVRSLGTHAGTVLASFWYYKGIKAFWLPLLLSGLCSPWTLIPVAVTALLALMGVSPSRWIYRRSGDVMLLSVVAHPEDFVKR